MNRFVIAAGSYIPSMTKKAIEIANVGQTACKAPAAAEYIMKVIDRKRKKKYPMLEKHKAVPPNRNRCGQEGP